MPKTIRRGDRGAVVEKWQTILTSQGFDPNGIDGWFGPGTARATREFQRAHDLLPDAIVGPKTWSAAEAATEKPQTLRRGSRGADVETWQRLLISKGFDPNGIDGWFGPGTERATKQFQKANGLKVDGLVSSATWSAALRKAIVAVPKPKPPKQGAGFLKDRIDIANVGLKPASSAAGRNVGVIRTWNLFGGVLTALSRELGIDADAAAAVLAIESGGTGFTSSGLVIRFENHIFFDRFGTAQPDVFANHFTYDTTKRWQGHQWRRATSDPWQLCHKAGQPGEWEVHRFAASLDESAAIMSTSIGLAQIMGFNYRRIGFKSPRAMLDSFSAGVGPQIVGFFDFVATSPGNKLITAIQNKDWYAFATGYNGRGRFQEYGDKMSAAYDQLRAAK